MKHTAFTAFHQQMGARMVEFAGYLMPLQYEGLIAEHLTVRNKAGVFDVSHMGEVEVTGPEAARFVQYITSNDVTQLYDGKVQYSCMPNGRGGIVDDLLVYRLEADKYLLVINAANIEKDWKWMLEHAPEFGLEEGKTIRNISDDVAQLAVQGPLAMEVIQKLTDEPVKDMEYYTHKTLRLAGVDNILLSTTGYTGSGGCEIYMPNDAAETIWKAVFEAGEEFGIKPAGLGARDTLRLEMGFCLYGNDIDDTTSPIEAGLGWITKFTPDNQFIDRERLEKQKEEGPARRLRGFEMIDKGIPRKGYEICDAEGNIIGNVTSGTMSPSLQKGIGMGYIQTANAKFGSEVFIKVRNKMLKAVIVKLPFYKPQ
ncbi:MAG: glycine cleavage system aminomethyltransferase GcvT [Bacteroidales bacterium]